MLLVVKHPPLQPRTWDMEGKLLIYIISQLSYWIFNFSNSIFNISRTLSCSLFCFFEIAFWCCFAIPFLIFQKISLVSYIFFVYSYMPFCAFLWSHSVFPGKPHNSWLEERGPGHQEIMFRHVWVQHIYRLSVPNTGFSIKPTLRRDINRNGKLSSYVRH